jgi:hypothetical protein
MVNTPGDFLRQGNNPGVRAALCVFQPIGERRGALRISL